MGPIFRSFLIAEQVALVYKVFYIENQFIHIWKQITIYEMKWKINSSIEQIVFFFDECGTRPTINYQTRTEITKKSSILVIRSMLPDVLRTQIAQIVMAIEK